MRPGTSRFIHSMLVWLIVALALTPAVSGSVSVRDQPCSSLAVQTDKGIYTIGESVNITVQFAPLLLGCEQPMIAHDYVVKTQVLNASSDEVYLFTRATTRNVTIHEVWTPTEKGSYTIVASSWFRLAGNESMTKQLQTSQVIQINGNTSAPNPGSDLVALFQALLAKVQHWFECVLQRKC